MSKSLQLKPRLSEKAYGLSEQRNTYVFDVPKDANRHSVAKAVTSQYEVDVESVKIATSAAKSRRAYRKRGRSLTSHRPAIRKAYVTLAEGSKLPLFASEDKSAKPSTRLGLKEKK